MADEEEPNKALSFLARIGPKAEALEEIGAIVFDLEIMVSILVPLVEQIAAIPEVKNAPQSRIIDPMLKALKDRYDAHTDAMRRNRG